MRYNDIDWGGLSLDGVLLFEGKLLCVKAEQAYEVVNYLRINYPNLNPIIQNTRNWDHWSQTYEKEIILNEN